MTRDESCPHCRQFTAGGCGAHGADGVMIQPMDTTAEYLLRQHGFLVAKLCNEDKEQLNRIEDMLKMKLSDGWRVSLLPQCRDVGAQCGNANCTDRVVLTGPGEWTHLAPL